MLQNRSFFMYGNPNGVNLSRLILKKGGFTPVLANHRKGIFPLKIAFLCESQRPVRRLLQSSIKFYFRDTLIFFLLTCS